MQENPSSLFYHGESINLSVGEDLTIKRGDYLVIFHLKYQMVIKPCRQEFGPKKTFTARPPPPKSSSFLAKPCSG
jgi:hypothetical protein